MWGAKFKHPANANGFFRFGICLLRLVAAIRGKLNQTSLPGCMNKIFTESRRWFCAIPMKYSETGRFWERDAGLVCQGLRMLGMDSRFVALGEPGMRRMCR